MPNRATTVSRQTFLNIGVNVPSQSIVYMHPISYLHICLTLSVMPTLRITTKTILEGTILKTFVNRIAITDNDRNVARLIMYSVYRDPVRYVLVRMRHVPPVIYPWITLSFNPTISVALFGKKEVAR